MPPITASEEKTIAAEIVHRNMLLSNQGMLTRSKEWRVGPVKRFVSKRACQIITEVAGLPFSCVVLMAPAINVLWFDLARENPKCELVAAAIVAEKEQMIERHVQRTKIRECAKLEVALGNPVNRPDETAAPVRDAIRFEQQFAQLRWELNSQLRLRFVDHLASGARGEFTVAMHALNQFFPHRTNTYPCCWA